MLDIAEPDPMRRFLSWRGSDAGRLALAVCLIALVTALHLTWVGGSNPTIVALLYLLVVLIVAAVATRWVAITTSMLAFICFNFFFLPPVGTFTIADPLNWVALFTLLTVSIVASHLSAQARQRAEEATARRDELARLFDLTRDILLTTETADALTQIARFITRRFGLEGVTIALPAAEGWTIHRSDDRTIEIEPGALDGAITNARAHVEFDAHDRSYAGHHRVTTTAGTTWLVPLRAATRPIGVLTLQGDALEPGTRDAIAGVTAIAIERTHLLEERKDAEVVRRSADLKSALLASLSHNLKTPLTAVTVAANNLNATWLGDHERREQADIVRDELERLNRLFQDIVDMARIEVDAVSAEWEWVQPAEIVEAAARQVERAIAHHRLDFDLQADRAFVRVDPRLTSAALAHLLENAGQYSPPGSMIAVHVALSSGELRISVRDHGAGIAATDLAHLFERFYRGADARDQRFGTGMGLAITSGLLAAQGGRVWVENHPDGGAVFTLAIPAEIRTAAALEAEIL